MASGLDAVASRDHDGDGRPEALVKLRSPAAGVAAQTAGATLALEDMHSAGARPSSPVAADLDADGTPEILVNDEAGGIAALAVRTHNRRLEMEQRWRIRGRAMADSESYWYGVVVCDVDADGQPEVICGRSTDRGQAELVVLDRTGEPEWSRCFPNIDGSDPVWNRGCLTYWAILNTPDGPAVYASVRRSLMHSDESFLLRGTDGEVIWHQDKVQSPHALRAVGGKMIGAADLWIPTG